VSRFARPGAGDFPAYYSGYVDGVPDGDVIAALAAQLDATLDLVLPLDDRGARFRYEPRKWSVKEVLVHVGDTERVFAYRALRFARGDATPLPGFEQDDYVATAGADDRTLEDIVAELRAIRAATLALFRGLPPEAAGRRGTASGGSLTVAAVPWIIAGHELHHRRILRERYLR
jgi:hypothetical protein